jgi:hypothetical protein
MAGLYIYIQCHLHLGQNTISGYAMCPYGLHTHVVMNGIYDYKPNHGCSHICHVLP